MLILPIRSACSRLPPALRTAPPIPSRHSLSTTRTLAKKHDQLPPRPTVPVEETAKKYLKGSGPGGQKINKTASAVQITHLPTGIVIKSQATRSRSQNETTARRLLAEKLELMEKGDESRVAVKGLRKAKRKASADKKKRRKYRALEGEKREGEEEVDEVGGVGVEGEFGKGDGVEENMEREARGIADKDKAYGKSEGTGRIRD